MIKHKRNPAGSRGTICPVCKRKNPPEGFYRNQGYCIPCTKRYYTEYRRERVRTDPVFAQSLRDKAHRYYRRHMERVKQRSAKYGRRQKLAAFDGYGGARCVCCGETHDEFLTIDHINGGGDKHRKTTGMGYRFYRWLIVHKFPPGFRVLCFNCNMARGHFGYCPHESAKAQSHGQ